VYTTFAGSIVPPNQSLQGCACPALLGESARQQRNLQAGCTPTLQAACYGRAFVPAGGFPRDGIVGVVRRLRLLNAMREPLVRAAG
jgi:hypothetical protein